jgi:hypothetical protein
MRWNGREKSFDEDELRNSFSAQTPNGLDEVRWSADFAAPLADENEDILLKLEHMPARGACVEVLTDSPGLIIGEFAINVLIKQCGYLFASTHRFAP